MPEYIAIVDGYSTAQHLPAAFRQYGKKVIHIHSSPEIPEILQRSYHPQNFDLSLPYAELKEIAAALRPYAPQVVIAGAESGVLYADGLAECMGLRWNVPSLSSARRNKYEMIEALQRAGLPTARQMASADSEAIARWARSLDEWPIVLKPPLSTSSEDVYFCRGVEEIHQNVPKIVGKTNYLGIRNEAALAQTYLDGQFYVVNSVSLDGEHLSSDVWYWEFVQNEYGHLNFTQHSLLHPSSEAFKPLVEYNNKALDAVGIRNGPSHSELKFTRNGPRLIETAARLMGATIERGPIVSARGITQVELTAMAICDPARFRGYLRESYHQHKHLTVLWVHFPHAGIIDGDEGCKQLESLPSFACYVNKPKVGTQVGPSKDTTGRGGFIYMLNEDRRALEGDVQRARRMIDNQTLFTVRQEPSRRK
ncbi:ATP-grasp domain-containing protein [Cystobacter fuscus]|uniref:ATP-grasp domain-containing protein n=1 Tax=Cystobacter fuscus TaxID=43 RepID=UPI002B319063|nr:ATP-grasp domain-containing protein [Cystobacter fuscus]